MNARLQAYAAVIVCTCIVLTAAAAAVGFALLREWRHVVGALIVLLFAFGIGLRELEEIRKDHERRMRAPPFTTTRGYPPQSRRPLR